MHRARDVNDLLLEEPTVLGLVSMMPATLGPSDAFRASRSTRPRSFDGDCRYFVAAQGHRGRIGAVCRVGNDHSTSIVAVGLVVGAHQQETGQLTGGPAAGCNVAALIPVMAQLLLESTMISSHP